MNRDPIGEDGGFNLYVHSKNSPVNNYDSLGLSTESEWRYYYNEKKFFSDERVGPADKSKDKKKWWDGLPHDTKEAMKKAWAIERYKNVGGGVNPYLENDFPTSEIIDTLSDAITAVRLTIE